MLKLLFKEFILQAVSFLSQQDLGIYFPYSQDPFRDNTFDKRYY